MSLYGVQYQNSTVKHKYFYQPLTYELCIFVKHFTHILARTYVLFVRDLTLLRVAAPRFRCVCHEFDLSEYWPWICQLSSSSHFQHPLNVSAVVRLPLYVLMLNLFFWRVTFCEFYSCICINFIFEIEFASTCSSLH